MEQFRRLTLSMTTLVPLHIGGQEGNVLATERVTLAGRVYVLAEDRLGGVLEQQGLLEDFSKAVVQEGATFNLEAYLRSHRSLSEPLIRQMARYSCRSAGALRGPLRAFVRDGLARPFVPGSAVKGAFRTAVMYVLLKRLDPAQRARILEEFVKRRLEEFRRDSRNRFGWFRERFKRDFGQRLDQDIFQRLVLVNDGKFDPHTDLLRALKVGDSPPFDRDACVVEEVKLFSLGPGEKGLSIFVECLPMGTTFTLEVTIDQTILMSFAQRNERLSLGLPFEAVQGLLLDPLVALEELARDVLIAERNRFSAVGSMGRAFAFAREPNARLGWGGGLLSTTVDLLLPEALRQDLRDTLFVQRRGSPAPKSRKISSNGSTLGWVLATTEGSQASAV